MQVLQLSDAEISALPPGQQEQVRQLVSTLNLIYTITYYSILLPPPL